MTIFSALDLSEIIQWIANHIGPIFIGIFFFVVPILRTIKEASEKKRKQAGAQTTAPAAQREAESEGRRVWEELLRGEAPPQMIQPPTPPPPPSPAASYEGQELAENAPSLSGRLSDFDDGDENAVESESAVDQERRAVEINDEMLRVEMARRSEFLARERESAARKTVAPDGLSTFTDAPQAVAMNSRAGVRSTLFSPGESRRAALRRAIVAREVLGPPLALRSRGEGTTPTALDS